MFENLKMWSKTAEEMKMPITVTSRGDSLIHPTVRKRLKDDLQVALLDDLNAVIEASGVEVEFVLNEDGLMMVVPNAEEGFFTVQFDTKIKNLDYEPFNDEE